MSYNLAGVIWNDDGTMATKELSPLEASKQLKDFIFELELGNVDKLFVKGSFDIIETALRNYEELTSKPVIWCGRTHGYTQVVIDYICKNYKEVKITNLEDEKKSKALEIIKEKGINISELKFSYSVNEYNICKGNENESLTKEEYDILKEVLL